MVGMQSAGLSHQKPQFKSSVLLLLGNKSTLVEVGKRLWSLLNTSPSSPETGVLSVQAAYNDPFMFIVGW